MSFIFYRMLCTSAVVLISFFQLSCSSELFARDLGPSDAVVKTYSYLCALPESDYRGSGVLIRHGDSDYVLTSEHVILWGQKGYCHVAMLQSGEKVSLDLVHSDWAIGLALLKLKQPLSDTTLPTLSAFSKAARDQDPVGTVGFPWSERSIRQDFGGHVLSAASARYFLANTHSAIELAESHGEFGMSGSPIIDETGSSIFGILSHQYLKLNAGGQTTLSEFNDKTESVGKNYLLVIPSQVIVPWLTRYFVDPLQARSSFVKEASDQQARIQRVYADGLVWTATKAESGPCAPASSQLAAFDDASLVASLVSGDPVGIGGDATSYGDAVEISVSFDRDIGSHLTETEWYLPSRGDWVRAIKDVLYRPGKISLTGLVYRNPESSGVERICVRSLEEFFRKMTSFDVSPISVVTSSVSTGPIEAALSHMKAQSEKLKIIAAHYQTLGLSINTTRWLNRMTLEAESAGDALQWELVPLDRFREYGSFDLYRDFWIELDSRDNAASIEVRKILIGLDNTLKKMRI